MLMKIHLKKIMTEQKIKNNTRNRTAKFLTKVKMKNNNMMRTTRPVTKEINMKRK